MNRNRFGVWKSGGKKSNIKVYYIEYKIIFLFVNLEKKKERKIFQVYLFQSKSKKNKDKQEYTTHTLILIRI